MENNSYDTFISGTLIDLVALNADLVATTNWYRWFNDASNLSNMQKHYYPMNKDQQLDYYKTEIEGNKSKLQLGIVFKKNNEFIGLISLNDIDAISRKAEISGFIGEKKYQKMKPFLEANMLLIRHGFNELNLHRIYGGTLSKDVMSFYCRLLGFRAEGVLEKDVYKNGKYRDVYNIGLLRENFNFTPEV